MLIARAFAAFVLILSVAAPAAADTAADLKGLLPKPLSGWKQGSVVALKVGQGFRAAGEYRPSSGPNVINVTYQTKSWDAEQKKKQLAAPDEAKKANLDVIDVGGRKWLASVGTAGPRPMHTLATVLDNGVVVTVSGFGDDRKAHEAYAAAVDAAALGKLKVD